MLVLALLVFWLWRRQAQALVAWQGCWSLFTGAVVLALLKALTVVLAGCPWVVSWGLTLWAAKIAQLLGWDPAASPLWLHRRPPWRGSFNFGVRPRQAMLASLIGTSVGVRLRSWIRCSPPVLWDLHPLSVALAPCCCPWGECRR